jgi:hypothetical protein
MALMDELLQTETADDPMSDKSGARKTRDRSISQEMNARGVRLCPNTAGKLLKHRNYLLGVNRKSILTATQNSS